MAAVEEEGGRLVTNQLDLFDKTPLLHNIENKTWIDYKSITPISANLASLEFHIPANAYFYTDLRDFSLSLKLQVVKDDGTFVTESDVICPTNIILHSLFSQCDMFLNQQLISNSTGNNYPYQAYFQIMEKEGTFYHENTLLAAEGFTKEQSWTPEKSVQQALYKPSIVDGKSFFVTGRLRHDLNKLEKYLPSGIDIRVKLTVSNPHFHLYGKEAENFKINIQDATLKVCHMQLTNQEMVTHANLFSKGRAEYWYERADFKVYQLPEKTFSHQIENVYPGPLPKQMWIVLVSSQAYSGSLEHDPFYFQHFDTNFIEVTKNGSSINGALRPSFSRGDYLNAYLRLFKNTNVPSVYMTEYPAGYTIFAFDLQSDQTVKGTKTPKSYGNVRVNLSFEKPLSMGATLIIYSTFSDNFYIDEFRSIIQT